jgi:hypothetical protein
MAHCIPITVTLKLLIPERKPFDNMSKHKSKGGTINIKQQQEQQAKKTSHSLVIQLSQTRTPFKEQKHISHKPSF